MNVAWKNRALLVDGKPIRDFPQPIRGALPFGDIIVVVLDGPKASQNDPPALVDEANRNVYGVDPDGHVRWRIASHGRGDQGSVYYLNTFFYVASYADTPVLIDGDGPNTTFDPATGKTQPLLAADLDRLVETIKSNKLQVITSPGTSQ